MATAMLLFGMPKAQSQENGKGHEMSVSVQGLGIGSMPFKSSDKAVNWNDQPGLSLGFNVGYTYWFGDRLGFRTGVRMSRLSHNQKITNLSLPITADLPLSSLGLPGGSKIASVNLLASASAIQEEQTYTYIELPLQLAMRFSDFFVNLGVSLSKAVSATADYSYTNPSLVITEVPELGIVPTRPVPMTLAGDTKGEAKNSTMTKPFYCLLDAEVGYNIPLGDATDLALGLFARYAPVSHKTDNSAEMYTLNSDATYTLSQPSTSLQVEKTGYYEVGVSLGLKFGLGRSHKSPAAQQQTTAPKSDSNYDELASELANVRASQKKTEEELASVRAKQKKAEEELAAMKDSQKRAQDELSSMKSENERARANAGNAQNNAKAAEGNAKAAEGNATMGKPVEGILFHFDFNKSKPLYDNTTESKLRDLCTRMQNNPELRVIIVGHTDAVGTKRNNNRMGRRRAKKVKQMMVDFGAPEGNIEIVTRGEREPIDTNETDNGRANNRRVTVEEM